MNGSWSYAFIAGLLLANPLSGFGLIPASVLSATEKPRHAWPYAFYGMLSVVSFSITGWFLRAALATIGLTAFELPFYIVLLWLINCALKALFHRSGQLSDQAPFFFTNCAVLGAGLLVIARYPVDLPAASAYSCGLAASFFVSVIVIAHFRERVETRTYSRLLAGWPSFLLMCALLWITFEGLGLLIK